MFNTVLVCLVECGGRGWAASQLIVSQRNAIHSLWQHCFFRHRAAMQGVQADGCGCDAVQSSLGDAVRDNATIAGCIECMDDACAFLRTKLISRVIGFRLSLANMTRWAQRELTVRKVLVHALPITQDLWACPFTRSRTSIGDILPLLDDAHAASLQYATALEAAGYGWFTREVDCVYSFLANRSHCGPYR